MSEDSGLWLLLLGPADSVHAYGQRVQRVRIDGG